jgi:uncharacterized membrane protein
MSLFHPKTNFEKIFEVGILLKGADGLIETIGGVLLFLLNPAGLVVLLLESLEMNYCMIHTILLQSTFYIGPSY